MLLITTSKYLRVLARPAKDEKPKYFGHGGVTINWLPQPGAAAIASTHRVKMFDVYQCDDRETDRAEHSDAAIEIAKQLGLQVKLPDNLYDGNLYNTGILPDGVYVYPKAFNGYIDHFDAILQVYYVDGEYKFAYVKCDLVTVVTSSLVPC